MNKILQIDEITEYKIDDMTYSGYRIITEQNIIKLLVNDEQICCEDAGYICSDENFNDYIGAEFIKYDAVYSKDLRRQIGFLDGGDLTFLNIYTDKGKLDFAVYNAHNGYYGHLAVLMVDGKIISRKEL